jgi:hypothetical protein
LTSIVAFVVVIVLLPSSFAGSVLAEDTDDTDGAITQANLISRKLALEAELRFVQIEHSEFYLVIDLQLGQVQLKAGGALLRSSPVMDSDPIRHSTPEDLTYVFRARVDPGTPEPGNPGLRLRGRRLPLDFQGRLVEGPREASRLYFAPGTVLQSGIVPRIRNMNLILLGNDDIKSLGSALRPGTKAFLIPDARQQKANAQ